MARQAGFGGRYTSISVVFLRLQAAKLKLPQHPTLRPLIGGVHAGLTPTTPPPKRNCDPFPVARFDTARKSKALIHLLDRLLDQDSITKPGRLDSTLAGSTLRYQFAKQSSAAS